MKEWKIEVESSIVESLAESISQGRVLNTDDGTRLLTEVLVEYVNGVKVEIFTREHPPPHFRVKYQGSTANFRISDCMLLNGSGQVMDYKKNIFLWWKDNKQKLIDTWNRYRPSDCPVGKYREN